jgi:hypothetical protein
MKMTLWTFPKWIILGLTAFLACIAIFILAMTNYTQGDVQLYQTLIQKQGIDDVDIPYKAKQQRVNLHKEILFTKGLDRLQMRLTGTYADLIVDHQEQQTDFLEHIYNVACDIQEEIYYQMPDGRKLSSSQEGQLSASDKPAQLIPMQVVRSIKADMATYNYSRDSLVAENVNIERYTAPGHKLVDASEQRTLLMRGTAQWAEFSLSEHGRSFNVYQLKAALYPPGGSK